MPTAETAQTPPTDRCDPQRVRVAVCEPDALLRALLGEWLRRAGFEAVSGSAPGMEAVALVVADVAAPRHEGAACLGVLRDRYPQAKVLAISAQFTPGLHATRAGAELGANAVLAKPFSAKLFMDTVHDVLAR